MRTYIIYASVHGHVKVLAEAIAEGAQAAGAGEVVLKSTDEVQANELANADAIIWGASGFFGMPNPKMIDFLSTLGNYWFDGGLKGKFGGVFGITSTAHGGLENLLRNLQSPMQQLGMIIVPNAGSLTSDRKQYACPYGAAAVIPLEQSANAPINKPNQAEMDIARDYGRFVVECAAQALLALR